MALTSLLSTPFAPTHKSVESHAYLLRDDAIELYRIERLRNRTMDSWGFWQKKIMAAGLCRHKCVGDSEHGAED